MERFDESQLAGEFNAMRCLMCGAEMLLMKVVQDDTMAVPGFEHHTFMCSACHDVEERLVFTRPVEQHAHPVPVHAAPPISPATAVETPASPITESEPQRAAAPSIMQRVFERLLSEYRH